MKELLFYYPPTVTQEAYRSRPDIAKFSRLFGPIFLHHMSVVDRTHTLKLPVCVKSLYPMPALRPQPKSFEQICNERALELLARTEKLGAAMYVSWSGGIDSTLTLVSLLKNATNEQKKNIVVLLTEESISENPRFYEDHIHRNLRKEPSSVFPYVLGSRHVFVNGELNDQLFGAQATGDMMVTYGDRIAHTPYTREGLFEFFNKSLNNPAITNFYIDLFARIIAASPVPIVSYSDYFWWLNFATKWQAVALRVLVFTARRNATNLSPEYVADHFSPFYGTDDFQLWSMNNLDKRIKDTWASYKWPCKEIIYDYTNDADYRDNKLKKGSLFFMLIQQSGYTFLDDSFKLYDTLELEDYYLPDNDFA